MIKEYDGGLIALQNVGCFYWDINILVHTQHILICVIWCASVTFILLQSPPLLVVITSQCLNET